MSSLLKDHLPYVSNGALSDNYVTLQNYQMNQSPASSILRMSVSSGNAKYFQASPAFEARTDSARIPPPSKTPVSVAASNGCLSAPPQNNNVSMAPDRQIMVSSDYYMLGNGAYKMNPQ